MVTLYNRQFDHKLVTHSINLKGRLLNLDTPQIMGILNVTPDSFFVGSRVQSLEDVLHRAQKMIEEGATFLDIGGYSTRPGAAEITVDEEISRVVPVIEALQLRFPETYLSIDTFRAKVARLAVEAGASMVNDIAGGNLDEAMFSTVAELGVPYVLMHSRGNPQTMSHLTEYKNLTQNVIEELLPKVAQLRQVGVKDIILDPGLGFAKTRAQNFQLLAELSAFEVFNLPLLVGVSRKSMIWKTLGIRPEEALNGTTMLNTIALQQGAAILRVHDVKEALQTIQLWQCLKPYSTSVSTGHLL
ncbi:MAG: dihydropteroate synthase [Spirosomataceae bacterium]